MIKMTSGKRAFSIYYEEYHMGQWHQHALVIHTTTKKQARRMIRRRLGKRIRIHTIRPGGVIPQQLINKPIERSERKVTKNWDERYTSLMHYWEKGNDKLTITFMNDWVVELNNKPIGHSKDLEEARRIAYRYMKTH
jgi:hypothetical protein